MSEDRQYRELLIGSGFRHLKMLSIGGSAEWHELTTLDINPDAEPDVVWDLNVMPLHPILAYVLSSLLAKAMALWRIARPNGTKVVIRRYIFETFFLPVASPINASLLYAVAYVLFWLGITALLYRKRIFIKV